jgi:cell division septal protein FtsQ
MERERERESGESRAQKKKKKKSSLQRKRIKCVNCNTLGFTTVLLLGWAWLGWLLWLLATGQITVADQ